SGRGGRPATVMGMDRRRSLRRGAPDPGPGRRHRGRPGDRTGCGTGIHERNRAGSRRQGAEARPRSVGESAGGAPRLSHSGHALPAPDPVAGPLTERASRRNEERDMSGYETLQMYIDGVWCDGSDGEYGEVINPATEEALARLPHAGTADLDRALQAAAKGFEVWRRTSPAERGKIMRKAADLMRERLESIARTLTLEEGKTIGESRAEVATSADSIDWYGQEGQRTYGRVIPPRSGDVRQIVVREPIGPVAAFTPWNFPGVTPARKIGGALGAGCSIIIKASEETPGTCVAMVRALADAGLPAGVCNLVFGVPAKISEYLIPSPIIRKVSFTGSIPVGKHLAQLAAQGMKPATMELGGHSPVIVFDDVDVEKVAQITVAGKYRNAGQVCISPTRFFVHDAVYDKFVSTFSELAKALPVGNGLDEANRMGSLANDRRMSAMDEFIADAVDKGAKLLAGGERIGNQGFFYQPTVLG